MKLGRHALKRLSICPCGYAVLQESIQLGTWYTLDLDSGRLMNYRCGRCNTVQQVMTVLASQQLNPDRAMAPIPVGLFMDLPAAG